MAGLSPKLTSLLYNGCSVAPDPEEIYHEVLQVKLACSLRRVCLRAANSCCRPRVSVVYRSFKRNGGEGFRARMLGAHTFVLLVYLTILYIPLYITQYIKPPKNIISGT